MNVERAHLAVSESPNPQITSLHRNRGFVQGVPAGQSWRQFDKTDIRAAEMKCEIEGALPLKQPDTQAKAKNSIALSIKKKKNSVLGFSLNRPGYHQFSIMK